jgi:GT2 family glycosyltransferase
VTPGATLVVHLDGGLERGRRCLAALAALDPEPEFEAIVVDDATAGLEGLLASVEGDVRVLRNERRQGLAASAAAAAELARGDVLVLLHGAPALEPGALGPLLDALAEPGLAGAAAALPGRPDAHPVCSPALALRRADAGCLRRAAGATPGLEMAAICAELSSIRHPAPAHGFCNPQGDKNHVRGAGGVVTIAASVAAPAGARAISARSAPGEAAELTIVIPTLDAASERVRACVAAIQTATEAPHQIVLVDNGAPPQGFTAPVNAGLRAVDTPYAVVMNDDVEPLPGWWAPLREGLDAGAAVTFPLTVEGGMREDFAAWCFALAQPTLAGMAHAPGEFFDPALRVWYQDTDLLARLRAAGRPPLLVREARIRHALSATVATEDPQLRAWIERTVREDRAAFLRKHPDADAAAIA